MSVNVNLAAGAASICSGWTAASDPSRRVCAGHQGAPDRTARTPATVSGITGAIDIAAGREHALALMGDGTVRAWGRNNLGQIGDGSTTNRPTPVTVPGLSGVTDVASGHNHAMALLTDGTVRDWGYNASGTATGTTNRRSPVPVSGLTGVTAIAGGRDMSYAIRSDGTLWAWGLNSDGELGDGTLVNRSMPVRVGTLTNVIAIAGGRDHGSPCSPVARCGRGATTRTASSGTAASATAAPRCRWRGSQASSRCRPAPITPSRSVRTARWRRGAVTTSDSLAMAATMRRNPVSGYDFTGSLRGFGPRPRPGSPDRWLGSGVGPQRHGSAGRRHDDESDRSRDRDRTDGRRRRPRWRGVLDRPPGRWATGLDPADRPRPTGGLELDITTIGLTWAAASDDVSTSLLYHVFRDGTWRLQSPAHRRTSASPTRDCNPVRRTPT